VEMPSRSRDESLRTPFGDYPLPGAGLSSCPVIFPPEDTMADVPSPRTHPVPLPGHKRLPVEGQVLGFKG